MKQMVLTLAFLAVFAGEAQGVWARRIPGTTFTWSFIEGDYYPALAGGGQVTKSTARSYIGSALLPPIQMQYNTWIGILG